MTTAVSGAELFNEMGLGPDAGSIKTGFVGRLLFYYRGSAGSSFFVYIDAGGTVCCYRHTQTLRMSSGNVW